VESCASNRGNARAQKLKKGVVKAFPSTLGSSSTNQFNGSAATSIFGSFNS
jgi:hypothetical protein